MNEKGYNLVNNRNNNKSNNNNNNNNNNQCILVNSITKECMHADVLVTLFQDHNFHNEYLIVCFTCILYNGVKKNTIYK